MKLKRQGFYREMPHGQSEDPSIFEFIQEKENADEEKIVGYLNQGIVLVACNFITEEERGAQQYYFI